MLSQLTQSRKTRCHGDKEDFHEEYQYLNLISDILEHGENIESRNGKTKFIFGAAMHFSLQNNAIPILTTKKTAWKTCLKELLWFVNGETDNNMLKNQGVSIWNANATRSFLDDRGLTHLDVDDLGPIYGHQWRHFNAKYSTCNEDYTGKGIDQLNYIIQHLKNPENRGSRRMIMTAWNPQQLDEMALPPCHILAQFNVKDGNKLSCSLYQRSGDVGLGVPFNIASYSFLTCLIAKHCDLEPYDFSYFLGNTHIYDNHIAPLKEQVQRQPLPFPTLRIERKYEKIDDYKVEDFIVSDYNHHGVIKMDMSA